MAFPQKAPSIIVRYRTRAAKRVRSAAKGTARRAWHRRALIAAPLVGLVLGWVHDNPTSVPTIPVLGATGTIAGAMLIGALAMPANDWLASGAAAALAVSTYQMKTEGRLTDDQADAASSGAL